MLPSRLTNIGSAGSIIRWKVAEALKRAYYTIQTVERVPAGFSRAIRFSYWYLSEAPFNVDTGVELVFFKRDKLSSIRSSEYATLIVT